MPTRLLTQAQASKLLERLAKAYPDARCSLNYRNSLELLIATILSAQCTDVLVNQVTPFLFATYRTAQDFARTNRSDIEQAIRRVNFLRMKARAIHEACQTIVQEFDGEVPRTMGGLLRLRGVARKTANVVLGNAFKTPAGVVVDTHVMRIAQRTGLTAQTDRNKIEQDLMARVPRSDWTSFSHRVIAHGRQVCKAIKPLCGTCPIGETLCPSFERSKKS